MAIVNEVKETKIVPVSEETKALVEQKVTDEPDEIKQKMGELVELIKKRAESEIQSTENLTRETYVKAIDRATQNWENFIDDLKNMGNRLDRAIDAAWKTLTAPETPSDSRSQ